MQHFQFIVAFGTGAAGNLISEIMVMLLVG
jgi:hypothetical protein